MSTTIEAKDNINETNDAYNFWLPHDNNKSLYDSLAIPQFSIRESDGFVQHYRVNLDNSVVLLNHRPIILIFRDIRV